MSEYKEIPLKQIIADPNQPRKFFDESALQELTDSIREKGLIQPITVRPAGKNKYMIVVGERRYRASCDIAAAFKSRNTIPAIVRELTDEEALELQIIENLQRKDVHPMEEAVSFQSLTEKEISVTEIALRVGKSPNYVAQRLKLNDLTRDFQELFFHNRLTITLALRIAKFAPDVQKDIYEYCEVPKDWLKTDFTIEDLYYLNVDTPDLSKATFSLKDEKLYASAGACTKCPHNSANNLLLFPENGKKKECYNSACFAIKTGNAFKANIEKYVQKPDILFIDGAHYTSREEDKKIASVKEMGVNVLNAHSYEMLSEYEHPGTWEDYLKENDNWSNDEEYTEEDREEFLADCKKDYEGEVEAFERRKSELDTADSEGRVKKAFAICGRNAGKVVDIIVKPKAAATAGVLISDAQEEIGKIQNREKRNQELDREKVYARTMPVLKEKLITLNDQLHPEEWKALAMMLDDVSPSASRFIKNKLDTHDWSGMGIMEKLQETGEYPTVYQAIRIAIYDRLFSMSSLDYNKSGKAAALYMLAKLWIPDQVAIFEQEQREKAEKRQKNITKRLAALQAAPTDGEDEIPEDDE